MAHKPGVFKLQSVHYPNVYQR